MSVCVVLEAEVQGSPSPPSPMAPTPTYLLVASATTESGPGAVCAGRHIPSGVPGFVRSETNPGVSDGPGSGIPVFPAQPRGLWSAATRQSAHLPGMTAPPTVERGH